MAADPAPQQPDIRRRAILRPQDTPRPSRRPGPRPGPGPGASRPYRSGQARHEALSRVPLPYTTLVPAEEVRPHLDDPDWAIMDCRFNLADPAAGRRSYLENHIPGAQYAHIDEDLSGLVIPGKTGRHPLPPLERLVAQLGNWGIDSGVQVVAYDASGGAMAARLWWLHRWLGHDAVAVLDGGLPIWVANGYPLDSAESHRAPRTFVPRP